MFTVRVIPLVRATQVDELTYFSGTEYVLGNILLIPLRGKEVQGVVIGVEPVRDAKATLRTSHFALRKIRKQTPVGTLLPEFIAAAELTAQHHASSVGAVLYQYCTKQFLGALVPVDVVTTVRPRLRGFIIPRLYQGLFDTRVEFYRTAVREAFAAGGSVLIVAPTVSDATRVYEALSTGIEQYACLIVSTSGTKVRKERIAHALTTPHPVLIVTTAGYLALPRPDLTTIIVEREGSSLHRQRTRPFVDTRTIAHHLAAQLGGQLFLADLPLRIESVHRKELGEYEEVVSGQHRMQFAAPAHIISLKGERREPKRPFRSIGRELHARVAAMLHERGRVLLYVARRGLSPVTLCGDCGTAVTCTECNASVVLHKGTEENYFLCHACGALRHARERCKVCQSWRLETFGVGAELVANELAALFPDVPQYTLSTDTVTTRTDIMRIVQDFYDTPGALLVATEMALPYLTKTIPLVGVVSLDSLLSLASWNIYEKVAATLTRLRELSSTEFVLQTRHPDTEILSTVLSGNFSGFYKSELRARKMLGYPPFTVIIKVSATGSEGEVARMMEYATELLKPFDLIPFARMLRAPGGKFSLHGFLRIARESWPQDELLAKLRSLPLSYTIMVDPDSIL
jgi:primosomal protein N'